MSFTLLHLLLSLNQAEIFKQCLNEPKSLTKKLKKMKFKLEDRFLAKIAQFVDLDINI